MAPTQRPFNMFSQGQSISEYALVLGLVVVASIAAIALLGGNINDTLDASTTEMGDSILASQVQAALRTNGSTSLSDFLAAKGYTGATQTLTFTGPNGGTITVSDYPTELVDNIDTLGANGTTEIMAQTMKEVVAQLLAQEEISNEQALTLIQLANKGYDIAGVQFDIEYGAQTTNSGSGFGALLFDVNGGQDCPEGYTRHTLYNDFMGANPPASTHDLLLNTNGLNGTELATFSALYQQAQTDGSLNNPAVNTLITSLSENIAALAYDTHTSAENISLSGSVATTENLVGHGATTTMNSDTVCTTGNGTTGAMTCS